MSRPIITINSRRFDGSISRSWRCEMISRSSEMVLFLGVFDHDIEHPHLGRIVSGTLSYEYYWFDKWFNVFRFHEPDGKLRNFYCNINMPPALTLSEAVLDYVDLDIDVVLWPDGRRETLDEDEFAANSERYGYPDNVLKQAGSALTEIYDAIDTRQFPFDTAENLRINDQLAAQ